MLLCPICAQPLHLRDRVARCPNGHTFDEAREGYLNLLRSQRGGDRTGDPKAQARSRRDFLNRGYYAPLRDELVRLVTGLVAARADEDPATTGDEVPGVERPLRLLDICCGEGYYTSALGAIPGVEAYGFDLAREMVRLAARRGGATYFVANMTAIPLPDASMDVATHLFAPFCEPEFARVLRPGATLFSVVPGARHLLGLKEVLYDVPRQNDERLPETDPATLPLVDRRKVSAQVELQSPEDIAAVFQMTPYYFRTSREGRARLEGLQTLRTDVEFVIGVYRRV